MGSIESIESFDSAQDRSIESVELRVRGLKVINQTIYEKTFGGIEGG